MSSSSNPSTPKTGFKKCQKCGRKMSLTDPHLNCLWYIGSDHRIDECGSCQSMTHKALKERRGKLAVGEESSKFTSSGRKDLAESSTKCHKKSRSRSRSRKSSSSSSKKAKKRRHRSHSSSSSTSSEEVITCPSRHDSPRKWEAFRASMLKNVENAAQTPSKKSNEDYVPAHKKSDRGRSKARKSHKKSSRVSSRESSQTPHRKSLSVHKSEAELKKMASDSHTSSKSLSKTSSKPLSKAVEHKVSMTQPKKHSRQYRRLLRPC
ncbi:uncharacterized protein [Ambystoma mexicanum]|uniref:uncharacterized protein n=1 Tax=Ambystoma mexicanum TaxID=8296 RepID=UPI0037E85612